MEKIIERLEELVEKISSCYKSIPKETLNELNELTQNGWSEAEYIEYCAEYWSRGTLEETVYALLHNGEYPDNVEEDLYFWKNKKKTDLTDEDIMYELLDLPEVEDEEFISNFEDLPIKEFYEWFQSYLSAWDKDKDITIDEILEGSFEVNFDYDNMKEYAKYKYITLRVTGKKMINLECCNLSENEKRDIISFANRHNLHLYEE